MAKKNPKQNIPEKKASDLIFYLIIIAVGFLVYSNSFHAPFTFDDNEVIVKNQALEDNTLFSQLNKPRYIGFITFVINYHINGLNTYGYHLVNIIIHILNALLVYLLVQKLLIITPGQAEIPLRSKIPLIVSLIFLVHPIQTQAVTYIVQRFTSLAACFSLISILAYVKFRTLRTKSYFFLIISIISCLLAYKTKENTATLPLILIAIEVLFFRDQKLVKERVTYLLPFVFLIVVIPLSFANINQPAGELIGELTKASSETQTISRTQYLFTEMSVIVTYIRLLLVPINQAIDYSYALSQSFFETRTLFPFLLLTAMLLVAVLIAKKYPVISFGIVWFFIFLAVESSIIPIRDVIYEHRLYLPSIGFIIAAVYLLFLIETKLKWKYFTMGFCIAAILVLAIAAYARNQLWNDQTALWKDAANKFPQNGRAIGNYAIMLADLWKCTEAMPLLNKAIELAPKNVNNRFALAVCDKRQGDLNDAISEYSKILEIDPKHQKASFNLADIYMERKDYANAQLILIKSKEYYPSHPYNNSLLALIQCESGNIPDALKMFDEAKKAGLNLANTYFNFGICLLNQGILQESRKNFLKASELNSNDDEIIYFIAVTYDTEKDYPKAAFYYKKFLSFSTKSTWIPQARQRLAQLPQ